MGRWRKRSMEDLAGSSNWFIGGDVVGISWEVGAAFGVGLAEIWCSPLMRRKERMNGPPIVCGAVEKRAANEGWPTVCGG